MFNKKIYHVVQYSRTSHIICYMLWSNHKLFVRHFIKPIHLYMKWETNDPLLIRQRQKKVYNRIICIYTERITLESLYSHRYICCFRFTIWRIFFIYHLFMKHVINCVVILCNARLIQIYRVWLRALEPNQHHEPSLFSLFFCSFKFRLAFDWHLHDAGVLLFWDLRIYNTCTPL